MVGYFAGEYWKLAPTEPRRLRNLHLVVRYVTDSSSALVSFGPIDCSIASSVYAGSVIRRSIGRLPDRSTRSSFVADALDL